MYFEQSQSYISGGGFSDVHPGQHTTAKSSPGGYALVENAKWNLTDTEDIVFPYTLGVCVAVGGGVPTLFLRID